MKLSVYLFSLVLIITNCHNEINVTDYPLALFAKWNWEISTGGIAGTSYTPESTGDRIVIEFTCDSIYREYKNDLLVFESSFHVIQSESIYNNKPANIIVYDNRSVRQSYLIDDRTSLTLYDEVYDGFVHQYRWVRK